MSILPTPRNYKAKEHLNGDSVKRRRGRPKEEIVTEKPVRLSHDMIEVLELWKSEYGVKTYDKAMRMALRDQSHKLTKTRKKAEALQVENERLQNMIPTITVSSEVNKSI